MNSLMNFSLALKINYLIKINYKLTELRSNKYIQHTICLDGYWYYMS